MSAVATDRVPARAEVPVADTWDLASLFPSDAAWGPAFAEWEAMIGTYATFRGTLGQSPAELAACKLTLERLLRFKPHTLSEKEERLLAMQIESAQTPRNVFDQLTDADLKFGTIELEPGRTIDLSHGSYMVCMEHPNREERKKAFHQYYAEFADHANTRAATLTGSIKQDMYNARVRNHPSA